MRLATKSLALALTLHVLFAVSLSQQRTRLGKASSPRLTIEASADTGSAKGAVVLKWSLKNNSGKEISVPDVNLFVEGVFVLPSAKRV